MVTSIGASELESLETPPTRKGEEPNSWVTDVPQLGLGPTLLPQCLLLLSPAQEAARISFLWPGAGSWSRAVLYLSFLTP